MIKKNSIINDDCFNVFPKIAKKSVDMVLIDLPYGQTACKWDVEIDLDEMAGAADSSDVCFMTPAYGM